MKVDFYLTNTMELSHFAPIAKHLEDAAFVSPDLNERTVHFGCSDAAEIDGALRAAGLGVRKFPRLDADAVVTTQSMSFVRQYHGRKIRMVYGVGLVAPEKQREVEGPPFDGYLVPGPFSARVQFTQHALPSALLPPEKVKAIGYPRFDEWWTLKAIRIGGRLRILWLPTWGAASSIDRFANAMEVLANKYEIWVKLHHGTERWEPERMKLLRYPWFHLWSSAGDSAALLSQVDIVLADLASGAFTESLLLGKTTIGLDDGRRERLLVDRTETTLCADPHNLKHFLSGEDPYRAWMFPRREGFVNSLFTTTRGHDGKVAADAIRELCQ